jgi:uncharacterized membrane protein YkoI
MSVRRIRLALALAVALLAVDAAAAEERNCLNKEQQRAAIASGKAVRLGVALKAVKRRGGGEVVRARLCEGAKGLVYMLTVLGRDGKVTRVTVDATSGDTTSSIGSGG